MEIAHLLVLLFSAARKAVVLHNLVNLFRFHILVDKLLDLHFLCYNGTLLLLPLFPKTFFGLTRNHFLLFKKTTGCH